MAVLASLGGCWLSGGEIDDKIGDTDGGTVNPGDLQISVSPAHGSIEGGAEVVVTARPARGEATVTFGGVEAEVVDVDGDDLTVVVPAGDSEEWVAVEVENGAGAGRLPRGFRYWQDGAGKAGLIGEVAWYRYVGTYWGDGADPYGEASVQLIHPEDVDWTDQWANTWDACASHATSEIDLGVDAYPFDDATVALEAPAIGEVVLPWDADLSAYARELDAGEWASGADLTLTIRGSDELPELDLGDLVETPDPIAITQPDVDGSSPPTVSATSFRIEWSGPYDGDAAVIRLIRYSDAEPVEWMRCLADDDGRFDVPAWAWSGWAADEQITIVVGRARRASATLPHNGGRVEFAGVDYAIGAAFSSWL